MITMFCCCTFFSCHFSFSGCRPRLQLLTVVEDAVLQFLPPVPFLELQINGAENCGANVYFESCFNEDDIVKFLQFPLVQSMTIGSMILTLRVAPMETIIIIWLQMSCNFLLLSHFRWESLSKGVQKKGFKKFVLFYENMFWWFRCWPPSPPVCQEDKLFQLLFGLPPLQFALPMALSTPATAEHSAAGTLWLAAQGEHCKEFNIFIQSLVIWSNFFWRNSFHWNI